MANNRKQDEQLIQIEEAIVSLKRGNKKLSISKIAEKAGIARKTIYNNPPLKARCQQEIYLQDQKISDNNVDKKEKSKLSGYKLIEHRYKKTKELLKQEQEKSAKLLENNRQLVLGKDQLKSRIEMLQQQIERLKNQKVTPMR